MSQEQRLSEVQGQPQESRAYNNQGFFASTTEDKFAPGDKKYVDPLRLKYLIKKQSHSLGDVQHIKQILYRVLKYQQTKEERKSYLKECAGTLNILTNFAEDPRLKSATLVPSEVITATQQFIVKSLMSASPEVDQKKLEQVLMKSCPIKIDNVPGGLPLNIQEIEYKSENDQQPIDNKVAKEISTIIKELCSTVKEAYIKDHDEAITVLSSGHPGGQQRRRGSEPVVSVDDDSLMVDNCCKSHNLI